MVREKIPTEIFIKVEIKTKRLILKELTQNDLGDYHRFCSIPEVRKFSTLGIPENVEESKRRLEDIIEKQSILPRKFYQWKVVPHGSETFLGMAGITLSLDKFKLGEIFYEIDPAFWGNGYATEIAKILIKTGFEDFYLHKVEAGVATNNVRSIKVLEKSGFTREGLRRKILPIRGKWIDNYHYAIVEDDPR